MGTFRWYTIPLVTVVLAAATWLSVRLADLLPAGILPVQLTAGVALAALLINGLRCWPGVFLGVYSASLWLTGTDGYLQALSAAVVMSGQALVGALLVRPLLREGAAMARDGPVLCFLLLAGPVACLVSAAATQLPHLQGRSPEILQFWTADLAAEDWLAAWSANVLGVLVAMPLTLALWSGIWNLRRIWGPRVALPLVLAGLLVVVGHVALFRFEMREIELEEKARLESVLQGGLTPFDRGMEALRSVEHFFQASSIVSAEEFAIFTTPILHWSGLDSIEWVPKVTADRPPPGADTAEVPASVSAADHYPSLYLVSAADQPKAQIEDYGGVPSYWLAMEEARDSGDITAAEPQPLIQTGQAGLPVVVPLYRAGFDSAGAGIAERRESLRGFIKGHFDFASLLTPLSETAVRQGVQLALVDLTPGSPPVVLLNRLPSDVRVSQRHHFAFAGRLLQLDLALVEVAIPGTEPIARLYQGFSVLAMFLIGLAVLTSAGRQSAAQAVVQARTAALRASERHLEVTLDSIGDGVLVVDTQGFVTRLNPMAEQLTGWGSRQAQGRPVAEVFHILSEESRQPLGVPVAEVLTSGRRNRPANRTVLIGSNGVERAIAHSTAPIVDAEGEPLGVVLVFRDISEERIAERALEASEQRYRELIEQAPYGIFVQTGGCFAYLNPMALRLLGVPDQAELLGRPVLDFLHPDSRDAVTARIHQLNVLGIPSASQEEKWMRPDGSVFYAEAAAAPHIHDGERGALVMLRDISARKAAETQRDRFFDLSLDPQCILDASERFVRVNAAFSQVLGWDSREFQEHCYLDLIHPDDRPKADGEPTGVHVQKVTQRLEARFRQRGGDWRWLSWNAVADEQGGLIYVVARDVTERRNTIQALTRARHEAEYANRAKSAFLATMSHEIRTPMNAVVGLAEVLSHSALSEHDEELVRNIDVSARSLLRLIDDILDFSKIEAGRLELEQMPVAIEVMVEDLCLALLPMAQHRGVSLSVFVAPELPSHILGDEVRLRQVFNNLIGNGIKFSAAASGGAVQVRVVREPGKDGDFLSLTVTDNGIGMSQDTLDHIFQPFTQGELSTTRRYGGTGLGLAISKRLVDLMGGDIRLAGVEGQGTVATVVLPLRAAADGAVSDGAEPTPDLSGIYAVVVDTPNSQASDWQHYLQHADATAIRVPTLAAGLELDSEGRIRVVVLDLRAPAHAALPVHTALSSDEEDTRFVLMDIGRRGLSRVQSGKVVILEGGVLRRRQLLQAVAMVVGRGGDTDAPESVDATAPDRPGAPLDGKSRILVVEDDDMNRKVIGEQLRLLGYTAEVVGDGNTALALWRAHRHDLVLTDLHMPEMDGYDFVRALRSEERPPAHTPVVALTANAMRGEEARARACGLDDYMVKPVSLIALEDMLRCWLSPEGGARRSAGREGQGSDLPSKVRADMPTEGGSVLDLAILRGYIGEDDSRVNDFITDYREAASQLKEEIFAANGQDDLEAMASFAHRLKSSSRWVGAARLGNACENLEKVGHGGSRSEVDDRLAAFARIYEQTLAAVDQYLRS